MVRFFDLPAEIRCEVYKQFYEPGIRFAKSTALLQTCWTVYNEAHETFLKNYLFDIVPLVPEENTKYKIWEHVEPTNPQILHHTQEIDPVCGFITNGCDSWRRGFETGILQLFESRPQISLYPVVSHRDRQDNTSVALTRNARDAVTAEEALAPLCRMHHTIWQNHGSMFAKRMMEQSPFLNALTVWGPKAARKIRHVRVSWGTTWIGYDVDVPAIALEMFSFVTKHHLTGLLEIHFRQFNNQLSEKDHINCDCALSRHVSKLHHYVDVFHDNEKEEYIFDVDEDWEEQGERKFHDSAHLLLSTTPKVDRLVLENWHRCWDALAVPDAWYKKVLWYPEMEVIVQSRYPQGETMDQLYDRKLAEMKLKEEKANKEENTLGPIKYNPDRLARIQ